ncbi:LOW QUALITY PROTEIN: neuronal tyrosine-phosphorylated phosphoinositide-3-kinase adapter 1-like [Megalops cyprinoides]|uniref:LOW QUALITY PROTEIN: neuronal tyrosine-phosphorylated phosphoinositide-3-kinase adapter 1-like n=1 Tax=Megalops cyprinoides TaxID=118141 RepID=UPI001864797E|nr:LOW QUALITY PROTEIN: neuronal tyrosine-phosphorylated phosphoinositide-3-kinase adapter 1-like [Megalops cyprinoides]
MSSGSAQDVAVEHFLRDIERRGNRLHCAVIGRDGQNPHSDMNLLYRKSRLDWRHRDSDSNKKSSGSKDPSATVGKMRDLASFRRHFRMGFMTMPASQDLSPRPCSSAMAPRSQSCHSVGAGGDSLENGHHSGPQAPPPSSGGRRPPAKPKRHPSTRLSSTADPRGGNIPPPPLEAPPPPPPTQLPVKHPEKRNAMKKSDSGEMSGRKVPPLKPKRSPNTHLSFDPPPPRVPPPATPLPRPSQESGGGEEDGEEEPVYIEMVGRAFSRRDSQSATPHPATATTTPDSDSDESEAIYEEMKYPLPEESEPRHRLPLKHDKPGASKPAKPAHGSAPHPASSSSLPHQSSSSSKPKATVSISHSSPLPSSSSSTPVPQPLPSGPQPPRAPTPFLFLGSKAQAEPSNKIPAPFPNLLQHRPPLLAFPQPAAASSGVNVQHKAASTKLGTVSTQAAPANAPPSSSSTSASKLPVLQLGPKEASGLGGGQQEKHLGELKDALLGPAPGLRARSHSTPLPPSSQSSSHYAHYHHHHPHHHPSHYHHYRKAEKELPTSHSMKLGPQASAQAQTQTQSGGGAAKEGKSVGFHLKSDKRERDRERETPSQTAPGTPAPSSTNPQTSSGSAPSPAPAPQSSSSQRPSSRPLLYRSHTPHPLSHGLPAYQPPPPDSPMLWTYPSVGLKRPPAYDSLRGVQLHSPHPQITALTGGGGIPKSSSVPAPPQQGKAGGRGDTGSLSRDGSGGGASMDEGPYWPMQRKLSFSHGFRETEKESSRVWNGSTDALPRGDREDRGLGGPGGVSGIPVRSAGGGGGGSSEGTGGTGPSASVRALGRSGLPLPCQTFPACHRNGELGRLGRSASTSGVRQGSSNVQRQCSLPRDALSQAQTPGTPTLSHQQLHQQLHLHLQYQHLAQLSQCQPPTSGGATSSQAQAQTQRDGKLLEVIERKRCLCKEIKAHRRPERSLCKQDSMPILPSWRRTPEPRKTGTPPCQRQQAVVWDTAI